MYNRLSELMMYKNIAELTYKTDSLKITIFSVYQTRHPASIFYIQLQPSLPARKRHERNLNETVIVQLFC